MINVFRIVKIKYERSAFSGIGSQYTSGRWHTQGKSVVYTSMSASLAALEVLVHWQPLPIPQPFVLCCATIPKSCIDSTYKNIDYHNSKYNMKSTQKLGDNWINSSVALALEVPSVIIPFEFNYIINPAHSDFKKLTIVSIKEFSFDQRLTI